MQTLLFDADAFAWKCAHFNGADPRNAISMIERIADRLRGGRVIVCLSDRSRKYWRSEIYPPYKVKKNPHPKPEGLDEVIDALAKYFISRTIDGLEADDVAGILATLTTIGGDRIIISDDKDLLTVPGLHYMPRDPGNGVFKVSEASANYNHMFQTLVGDSCDCYPGCPGVGPKRAAEFLQQSSDAAAMWQVVLRLFQVKGIGEQDAITQARIARICRAENFDLQSRRVVPWNPPV